MFVDLVEMGKAGEIDEVAQIPACVLGNPEIESLLRCQRVSFRSAAFPGLSKAERAYRTMPLPPVQNIVEVEISLDLLGHAVPDPILPFL